MKIGEVVERSGVSHKALRLYEARGILPSPRRTVSGYRVYADDVISLWPPRPTPARERARRRRQDRRGGLRVSLASARA